MFELPLFPLNTVLFPGMPLALHIFEDRYKLMIGKCLQERRPFGVVLIKKGAEALGPVAEPYAIGCSAYVTQVERLEQGRMNIGVIGRERFRILALDGEKPYLVGQVERYPLPEADPFDEARAAERLRPWILRYLKALPQVEDLQIEADHLPDEPLPLAFLAATLLQLPAEQKQSLLAAEGSLALLNELRLTYRREVALVKSLVVQPDGDEDAFFSLN